MGQANPSEQLPARSRFNKSTNPYYYEVDLNVVQTDGELHQAIMEGINLYQWRQQHARSFHEAGDASMMLDAFVLTHKDSLISLARRSLALTTTPSDREA